MVCYRVTEHTVLQDRNEHRWTQLHLSLIVSVCSLFVCLLEIRSASSFRWLFFLFVCVLLSLPALSIADIAYERLNSDKQKKFERKKTVWQKWFNCRRNCVLKTKTVALVCVRKFFNFGKRETKLRKKKFPSLSLRWATLHIKTNVSIANEYLFIRPLSLSLSSSYFFFVSFELSLWYFQSVRVRVFDVAAIVTITQSIRAVGRLRDQFAWNLFLFCPKA